MFSGHGRKRSILLVWNYDPISRGLKHGMAPIYRLGRDSVWNYDPISRGLKPWWPCELLRAYDPISRGLKLGLAIDDDHIVGHQFGTMTRFLGD